MEPQLSKSMMNQINQLDLLKNQLRHLLTDPMIELLEREIKVRTILIIPAGQKGMHEAPGLEANRFILIREFRFANVNQKSQKNFDSRGALYF